MTTIDFYVLLTFLILFIPYGFVWVITFRYLKKDIKSILNYSLLILLSLVGLVAYYILAYYIGENVINGPIGNLIGAAAHVTVIFGNLLIFLTFILTLILTIIHFVKNKK
jgi:hypothetical protein